MENKLEIIYLNIWGGKLKEKLLSFLQEKSESVDIFCFQEVFDNGKTTRSIYQGEYMNIFNDMQTVLPNHKGYFVASEGNEEGLSMFVKNGIDVVETGDVFVYRWKDAMENDDSATLGRNVQYVSINKNNKKYLVASFHGLWNGVNKLDSADRIDQSNNITKFIASRNEEHKILGGDFNLRPDTESVAILEKDMKNLVKEYGITSTRTSLYTKPEKFADYVFISPNINVDSFEVLPEEVSDHAAMKLIVNI